MEMNNLYFRKRIYHDDIFEQAYREEQKQQNVPDRQAFCWRNLSGLLSLNDRYEPTVHTSSSKLGRSFPLICARRSRQSFLTKSEYSGFNIRKVDTMASDKRKRFPTRSYI